MGFKVPIEFAERLDELAKKTGLTKNIIIMQAVELWAMEHE
ncbi:ribbon-helix-helix protein, CopG family [Faucicola mancuniensis]